MFTKFDKITKQPLAFRGKNRLRMKLHAIHRIFPVLQAHNDIIFGRCWMLNSGEARPVWDQIMGMAVLAMLPPILVVLSMQKLFVKGLIEREK